MKIEGRQFRALLHKQIDPWQAAQQSDQWLWHFQDHPHSAGGGQRGIAAELEGVAEPLLGMDQQRPPLRRLTSPLRLREGVAAL